MNLGLTVMLNLLCGKGGESPEKYYGKTIREASLIDNIFSLQFDDGVKITLTDEGQSCCEDRYITCDDNISDLHGDVLRTIEVSDGGSIETDYGDHEMAIVKIASDKSSITLTTHNEHNGYYGGFSLMITEHSG